MFMKKVGNVVGAGAAYTVHGMVMVGQLTGQVGKDLVAGTKEGFVAKNEELRAKRQRAAALTQPIKVEVEIVT